MILVKALCKFLLQSIHWFLEFRDHLVSGLTLVYEKNTPNIYFSNNVCVKLEIVNVATFMIFHYFNTIWINKHDTRRNQSLAKVSSAYSFHQW